jgi:hypothetical protein
LSSNKPKVKQMLFQHIITLQGKHLASFSDLGKGKGHTESSIVDMIPV